MMNHLTASASAPPAGLPNRGVELSPESWDVCPCVSGSRPPRHDSFNRESEGTRGLGRSMARRLRQRRALIGAQAGVLTVLAVGVFLASPVGLANTPHEGDVKLGACSVTMHQPRILFLNGAFRPYGKARIHSGCGGKRVDVYLAWVRGGNPWFSTCCRLGYASPSPQTALSQGRITFECDGRARTFATYVKIGPCTGAGCTSGVPAHRHDQTKTVVC
jgi:hypothetical protein